jgi:hypothetical protein
MLFNELSIGEFYVRKEREQRRDSPLYKKVGDSSGRLAYVDDPMLDKMTLTVSGTVHKPEPDEDVIRVIMF